MFNDFYAALAQVLPVLLLALMWDSDYLVRLRRQRRRSRRDDPKGVWFWTKQRVRIYIMIVAAVLVASTATTLFVLAGIVPDSQPLRLALCGGLILALITLLWRICVDIILATMDRTSNDRSSVDVGSPAPVPAGRDPDRNVDPTIPAGHG